MKIGICGKICSGKTYISDFLVSNYNFKRYSFGEGVKEVARSIFDMRVKDRKLLQEISGKMKEINSDIWINYLDRKMKEEENMNIVIDDLRFENEYEYLKKNGFMLIKLNIDDDLQKERIVETYPENFSNHLENRHDKSENLIDLPFCFTINISKESEDDLLNIIEKILK